MPEDTLAIDELVYDFPGRSVRLKRNDTVVKDMETFGVDPFRVGAAEIEIREKFVHVRGDLLVTLSWREGEYNGEPYKEGFRIEEVTTR